MFFFRPVPCRCCAFHAGYRIEQLGGERFLKKRRKVLNLKFKVSSNTAGSPPTLAQRVLNETLWNPAFLNCALSLAGYVSAITVTGWKSCRCAVSSLGTGASGLQSAPLSKISESPAAF